MKPCNPYGSEHGSQMQTFSGIGISKLLTDANRTEQRKRLLRGFGHRIKVRIGGIANFGVNESAKRLLQIIDPVCLITKLNTMLEPLNHYMEMLKHIDRIKNMEQIKNMHHKSFAKQQINAIQCSIHYHQGCMTRALKQPVILN